MRLQDACVGAVVAAALAIGGCSSKAELKKATSDLAAVTAERNGLEAQLDDANNKNTTSGGEGRGADDEIERRQAYRGQVGAHASWQRKGLPRRWPTNARRSRRPENLLVTREDDDGAERAFKKRPHEAEAHLKS